MGGTVADICPETCNACSDEEPEQASNFLEPGSEIEISGLEIILNGETDNSFLEVAVNQNHGYSFGMDQLESVDPQFIRIGSPTISSNNNHVFINGSGISQILDPITISESNQSACINKNDEIKNIIPNNIDITWSQLDELILSGEAFTNGKVNSSPTINAASRL